MRISKNKMGMKGKEKSSVCKSRQTFSFGKQGGSYEQSV